MTKPPAMPELPEPDYWSTRDDDTPLYTADQMRAYALAALQAQPAEVSDADVWELWLRVCAESDNVSTRVMIANFARALRPQSESEPFGYFRSHLWGWTDCGPDDEGAMALYERPQVVPMTLEPTNDVGLVPVVIKPFTPAQRRRLWDNSPEIHKDAASITGFERIVSLTERAHGITAQGAQGEQA